MHLLTHILVMVPGLLLAQSNYAVGLLPSINFNQSLPHGLGLNFKTESRFSLQNGTFGEPATGHYRYILTDVSAMATVTIGPLSSVGLGYLARITTDGTGHRMSLQYVYVNRKGSVRMSQRAVADKTYFQDVSSTVRIRYRFTAEIPLDGNKVDPREFYFKPNTELLYSWQGSRSAPELRVVPVIGYVFTDYNKLEAGIDYRFANIGNPTTLQTLWFVLSWYIKN